MKLGMQVGLGLGHIPLDGDPAPPPQSGRAPQFSAHICCGQTAGWIKMALGMEVGLDPGHIVLRADPAPPKKGHRPQFSAHVYCGQTVAHLSWCWALVYGFCNLAYRVRHDDLARNRVQHRQTKCKIAAIFVKFPYIHNLPSAVTLGGTYNKWSLWLDKDMASAKRDPGLQR